MNHIISIREDHNKIWEGLQHLYSVGESVLITNNKAITKEYVKVLI